MEDLIILLALPAIAVMVVAVFRGMTTALQMIDRENLTKQERKDRANQQRIDIDDNIADARRWIEWLGSEVLNLSGSDPASSQAMADASGRYNSASSQISKAKTVKQAQLARESALEGLYYVKAARNLMGLPPGPELPPLAGQSAAGSVTEQRTIDIQGRSIFVSPVATNATPNYFPGGHVAGRPIPAGWYSEPWWQAAMRTGTWTASSVTPFSAPLQGMEGVDYPARQYENGIRNGHHPAREFSDNYSAYGGSNGFSGSLLGGNHNGGFLESLFGDGKTGGFFGSLFGSGSDDQRRFKF